MSHVIADMLKIEICSHSLSARINSFGAALTGQPIVELLASRKRSYVKSLELVDVILAKHFFLLYQQNYFIFRV